jgi:hypothetical protein
MNGPKAITPGTLPACPCDTNYECDCECSRPDECGYCQGHLPCQGLGQWYNKYAVWRAADGTQTDAAYYGPATPSTTLAALGGATLEELRGETTKDLLAHLVDRCSHLAEDAKALADAIDEAGSAEE